jgi:outer membrane protein assembly factor BamB
VATAHFLVTAVQRGVRPGDGSPDGAVVADILTVLDNRASREDVAHEFARTRARLLRPDLDTEDLVEEALHWTTHLHAALREDFGISAALAAQLGARSPSGAGAGEPIREEIFAQATRSQAEAARRRGDVAGAQEWAQIRHMGLDAAHADGRADRAAARARPDRGRPGAMFRGGPARTGDYGIPGAEPEGPFDWAYHTGGSIRSSPVVGGDMVYIGSAGGGVHAVDAATGAARWTHPTGGAVDASPALADDTLFITSTDGVIHALDAAGGGLRWACDTGRLGSSSPAVADGVVVVGGPANRLLALDAETGRVRWTAPDAGAGPAPAAPIESSPAIADGVVYSNAAHLLALDLATGQTCWTAQVSTPPTISPAVADGVVYTGDVSGAICAVDAVTGAVRWRSAPTGVLFAFSTVALADQIVVACGQGSVAGGPLGRRLDGGVVVALDVATGAERWRYRSDDPMVCSPAVAGGAVYVIEAGAGMHLLGLTAQSGELRQRRPLPTAGRPNVFMSSPALADGTLYVGLPDGRLVARPAESSSRSGFRRRLAAWWGRAGNDDHLPALREDDPGAQPPPEPEPGVRMSERRRVELQQLADQYATAADAAAARGDIDDAVTWSTRAVDAVTALREALPGAAEHTAVLAAQLYNRAAVLERAGDIERAVSDARGAAALYDDLVPTDPPTFVPLALDARSRLTLLLAIAGHAGEARRVGAAVIAEHRELAQRHPGHEPGLARSLARYSDAMVKVGDRCAALAAGREALTSYRRRAGALGLDETLAFGRTAYNVATLLLPPSPESAGEGRQAADDAVAQLTIVADAGMGDAVSGARMLAQAFRAEANPA